MIGEAILFRRHILVTTLIHVFQPSLTHKTAMLFIILWHSRVFSTTDKNKVCITVQMQFCIARWRNYIDS